MNTKREFSEERVSPFDTLCGKGLTWFFNVLDSNSDIHCSELRSKAATALKHFGDLFLSHLKDNNRLPNPPAIQLRYNPQTAVLMVTNDPVQKVAIEAVARQSDVVLYFKEVELLYELLHQHEDRRALDAEQFNVGLTSLGAVAFFTTSPRLPGSSHGFPQSEKRQVSRR